MTQLIIGQLLNGIIVGSLYGIIALGVTLTFGLTGIVNFALGAFMMLGAYSTWYLYDVNHLPYPVAVVGAVLIVSVIGYLSDLFLFRFTRGNLVNGLLVSIGLISVFEALVLAAFTTTPKDLTYVLPGAFQVAGMFLPKIKVVVCLVFLAIIFGTYLALTRTWLGRAAFAYAQNPEAAALMGIRTERLQTIVVVYSTALAGLGGGLYASMYSLEPTIGAAYILKAATEKVGRFDKKELANAMRGLALSAKDHPGILLDVRYDDQGNLDRASFIVRVMGRRHEFIAMLPALVGGF